MGTIITIIKFILAFFSFGLAYDCINTKDKKKFMYWIVVAIYWTLNFIQGLI